MSLFTWLLDLIFPPRATQLLMRAAFVKAARISILIARPRVITIQHIPVTTLLPYRSPLVEACIIEAKYHKSRKAQELLGTLLADYIKVSLLESDSGKFRRKYVLVPLPLGKKRRKERGYNQVDEIARFAEVALRKNPIFRTSISLEPSFLERVRETAPQTTLGREARKANMTEAFIASSTLDPRLTYVLLDDVVTTGASLLAGYQALRNAGATSILLIALAH